MTKQNDENRYYDSLWGGALKTVVVIILLAFIARASFRERI
jgi:hypothetical protein